MDLKNLVYTWKAIYNDGTELSEFSSKGEHIDYYSIDRSKLNAFIILANDYPKLIIHLRSDKRLIFRRRRTITPGGFKGEVILAGWQTTTKDGVNVQALNFLFEDGRVELVDGFREGTKWFYPITFKEGEQ